MKIEKLPSGSYRMRKMYKGTTYTVITEYKPTQKKALQLLAAEMDKVQTRKTHMTFREASDKYIEVKENVLSPSTITGYRGIQQRISESTSMDLSLPFWECFVLMLKYPLPFLKKLNRNPMFLLTVI